MNGKDSDPFISSSDEFSITSNENSIHDSLNTNDDTMLIRPGFSRFSISIPETPAIWWKTFLKFVGPGYMIAVGYLDPGNWATDLAAGSKYGYKLLFIIFLANIMAIKLQALCLRLGVVSGFDLAQACARFLPRWASLILYVMCELAIIATDLAGNILITL